VPSPWSSTAGAPQHHLVPATVPDGRVIVTLVCLPLDVAGVPTRVIPDACGGAWERATLTVVRLALAPNVEVSVPVGPLAPVSRRRARSSHWRWS